MKKAIGVVTPLARSDPQKMRELKSIHLKGEYWRNKHCKQCIEGFSGT